MSGAERAEQRLYRLTATRRFTGIRPAAAGLADSE
jgi:hypothetical protein